MTDDSEQNAGRSATDKERARQESRAIGAKPAGKGAPGRPAGQPGKGQGTGGARRANGGPARADRAQGSRNARNRPPAKGAPARGGRPARPNRPVSRPGPRRSPTSLLTWGVVALVLIVVVVLVVLKVTGGSPSNASSAPTAEPVPASVAAQVTQIPAAVYNEVGVNSPNVAVSPPTVLKNQTPLTIAGKPAVFSLLGEYCPYCAAERWALVAAFSRFGTMSNLYTMQSSGSDVFPNTPTFTFANMKYSSPYVTLNLKEVYSNQLNSAGTGYSILQPLTRSEAGLASKYDTSAFLGSNTQSGSIPFTDIGNKFLTSGASYSPSILAGLTRNQIASVLSDPKNPVTQAIVATANYLSAATCAVDGQQPTAVCTSSGVTAAARALKLGA